MHRAYKTMQLAFTIPDELGLLTKITKTIGENGINIIGISAYSFAGEAQFLMATDDNEATARILQDLDINAREESITAVEMANRPGELQNIAAMITDAGINIDYMYATTVGQDVSLCYFKTSNEDRTIAVINTPIG